MYYHSCKTYQDKHFINLSIKLSKRMTLLCYQTRQEANYSSCTNKRYLDLLSSLWFKVRLISDSGDNVHARGVLVLCDLDEVLLGNKLPDIQTCFLIHLGNRKRKKKKVRRRRKRRRRRRKKKRMRRRKRKEIGGRGGGGGVECLSRLCVLVCTSLTAASMSLSPFSFLPLGNPQEVDAG